jgi:RNA polymerase sigma-70 factor (ECF subfamily)
MNMVSHEFGELVARHYEPLYKFAFSLTRAEADAGDLTQQTFYLWATKGHQLRDRSKVKTWLFTTLHRIFLEARRRQTRFPHRGLDEVSPEDLPASSPPSDDHLDSAEALRALALVGEVYQGAVALYYLEDCSYREIAEILEVPEGTVKSRITRGITQLRHLMGYSASTQYRQTANPENGEETDCSSTSANSESRAE